MWLTYPPAPSIVWPDMTRNMAKFANARSSCIRRSRCFRGIDPSEGKKNSAVPTATKKRQKARTATCFVSRVFGCHFRIRSSATTLWATASNCPVRRACVAAGFGRPRKSLRLLLLLVTTCNSSSPSVFSSFLGWSHVPDIWRRAIVVLRRHVSLLSLVGLTYRSVGRGWWL